MLDPRVPLAAPLLGEVENMALTTRVEGVGLHEGVPVRLLVLPDGSSRSEAWVDSAWVPSPSIVWDLVNVSEVTPEMLSHRFGMPLPDVTPLAPPKPLGWDDVADAANAAFHVWVDQPELCWAKRAWEILEAAGMTTYTDEFTRYGVIFRFLVLGGIYNDFCDVAWGEESWIDYSSWAEPFDLQPFVIGQLYARLPEWEANERVEESDALDTLVENQRDTVVSALLWGFGDESSLYASLWESRYSAVEDDGEDDEDAEGGTEFIIPGLIEGNDPFGPVTASREAAYCWVRQGCNRHR